MRGSAPSFGITTSIEVKTFAAPPSVTVFRYDWNNLDAADAANGIAAFQTFVQSDDVPSHFGGEINLLKSTAPGTVSFELLGGWYGPESELAGVLFPLLARLPQNPQVNLTSGTYLDSVVYLSGGSLNTTQPDRNDTFYVKSLMTPQSSPMSTEAITAFINYLANEGQGSTLVSFDPWWQIISRNDSNACYPELVCSSGAIWREKLSN